MNAILVILLVLLVIAIVYSIVLLGRNKSLRKSNSEAESTIKDYEHTNNELIKDKNYYRNLYNQELDKRAASIDKATKAEDKLKAIHDDLVAYKKVWKSYEAAGIKKAITIFRDHCAEMPLVEEASNVDTQKKFKKPARTTA